MTESVLLVAHVFAMIFAAFRLTEMMLYDRITLRLRQRWPHYLWQCFRCLSIWAGGATVVMFLLWPWLNWPLALSYFYIIEIDWRAVRRQMIQRRPG